MSFDHYDWTRGLEFHPSWDFAEIPSFASPFVAGFVLTDSVSGLLSWARIVFALAMILGVRTRLACLIVGISGLLLIGADRFRYFHHTYLLYLSCIWLAYAPCGARMSLERWVLARIRKNATSVDVSVRPLVLLRAVLLSVYAAAMLAKCNEPWLTGRTLQTIADLELLDPTIWGVATSLAPEWAWAWAVVIVEGGLVVGLACPRTRNLGVAVGVTLHLSMDQLLMLSTFSWEMFALLSLFLPWRTTTTPVPTFDSKFEPG